MDIATVTQVSFSVIRKVVWLLFRLQLPDADHDNDATDHQLSLGLLTNHFCRDTHPLTKAILQEM